MASFKVGEAPWEVEERSAYSAKPTDLNGPVPKEQPIETPPPTEGLPEFPVGQAPWEQPQDAAPTEDQFAPEPGFIQANIEQFNPKNLIDRVTAGLAANDTEKVNFLTQKYGKGNVAQKDGKIYFRRSPEEKLRPLDPATLELVSDILPDFAREIVTEGAMLPAEALGAAGGALATGPAAPAGAVAGGMMGRVAAVPFANKVADTAAQMAGVPGDPTRDKYQENMIGQGVEAVAPVVGRGLVKGAARILPGTAAYKAAREAGDREVVALAKQSRKVLEAADDLKKEGFNVNLTLDQVQPDSPQVKAMAEKVKNNPELINKKIEFAEDYGNALRNVLDDISKRANPKGAQPQEKLGSYIVDAVDNIDRAEGMRIGEYRRKALSALQNRKVPLPKQVSNEVIDMMNELGFERKTKILESVTRPGTPESLMQMGVIQRPNKVKRQIYVPPTDIERIIGRLGLTDAGQARAVINTLNEYGQLVARGDQARLTDVERLIKRMGPLNQKLQGTAIAGRWGAMTGALREHRREIIKSGLNSDVDKKIFDSAMDEFSLVRQNLDQLKGVLRDDVTSKTLVNSYFKGKENLANIRALKAITGNDSPQWGALKEEFLNQLALKHSSDGKTGFNSKAFLNDLEKNYGDEFMREVINDGKAGPNLDTIKKILTVGQRMESVGKNISADNMTEQQKRGLTDVFIGLVAGIKFKAINGVQNMLNMSGSEKNTVMEILNRDGFEKYLQGYKGKDKGRVAQQIESMVNAYNAGRAANSRITQTLDAGADILGRGTRATIRQDMQRTGEQ